MGFEQDVTLGEIARAVARIEHKVDEQGDTITSVNLRLTAIEAQGPPGHGRLIGAGSLGAFLTFAGDWLISHLGKSAGNP